MSKVENAIAVFKEGFNCSQAIFSTYGPQFGIEREIALRIACPFGAGMAGKSQTCGAVTGALMVIGLKWGNTKSEDRKLKENAYKIAGELAAGFKARNGSLNCSELLGYDLGTPEGFKTVYEKNMMVTHCAKFVRDAAEILEELLK